ncbi:hypothetical protein, partial [Metallibacterium scheffleri]|uniref:hypothetical protein n=1 Tax=Metallibacterium scheffleri TaxID=993689 RepID=UPI0023F03F17
MYAIGALIPKEAQFSGLERRKNQVMVVLIAETLALWQAEPWARWSDEIDLALEMSVGGEGTHHAAVVMGNAGLQRGLVVYPGEEAPAGLRDWHP